MRTLAAVALLLAPGLASAQDMAWSWTPQGERSFYVESVLLWNSPVFLQGERNLEVRATQIEMKFLTTCVTEEDGKRRWQHTCTIDDIGLLGIAFRAREDKDLARMLVEMDRKLTGASVQVRQRTSGKIVGFDLQGVDKRNQEMAWTHEQMRKMLRQSFSGLDLEFSSYAAEGLWVQPVTRMTEFVGSFGSVPIAHQVAEEADNRLVITSFGKGSVGTQYDVKISGDALWDNTEGTLLYRSWKVLATERQATGTRVPLANTGWIAVIGDGEERPNVGETGLWNEHAVRDTAITLMDVLLAGWIG